MKVDTRLHSLLTDQYNDLNKEMGAVRDQIRNLDRERIKKMEEFEKINLDLSAISVLLNRISN